MKSIGLSAKRSQNGDIGVSAQAKHVLNIASPQEINDMFCDCFSVHFGPVHHAISCP
jgi:hypothetical protein